MKMQERWVAHPTFGFQTPGGKGENAFVLHPHLDNVQLSLLKTLFSFPTR